MSRCWVCDASTETFFTVADVPSSSCVLHMERSSALDQPIGSISLSACQRCGLIQNDSFDPALVDYLAPYEESQGSSATFTEFVDDQLQDLARRYELSGKRLLEVGSGKGEWLAAACRTLHMSGVGVDPGYVPGRVGKSDEDRFEVVLEFFDESSSLSGDLVASRHTLEHVSNPVEFISALRMAAVDRHPGLVFIEVPDSLRILNEGAFWDVYYEHSIYVTEESLRNLLKRSGLEVLSIRYGFDGQYLLAEAIPASDAQGEAEITSPAATISAVRTFTDKVQEQRRFWRTVMGDTDPERTVVWAATSKTVSFLGAVGGEVTAAVDINVAKHGSFLPGSGVEVVAPERLVDLEPEVVIIMNPIYRSEITAQLDSMGLHPRVLALGDSADL